MARSKYPWFEVAMSAWLLGLEASAVVGLRTVKIAVGGVDGAAEARRMVSEKIDAGLALQTLALTGGLGFTPHDAAAKTLTHYRRKVRANRRRLSK
jgi:ABC-type sugar transport system substrate-binding protein